MSKGQSGQRRPRKAKARTDRRDATAPRLQYEALVEVGAGKTGGFEAESVDVSLDGMRLRTAYLPKKGERMVCRFDGFGGEIVAEGQVVWCNEDGRGGEFGIAFTNLDEQASLLLEDLCDDPEDVEEEEPEPSVKGALPGSRVRLHIQGLGSPMRARVREVATGEVLIGSNLEFLKVGQGVELEDVEHGKKATATIDHVGVDVDPETRVPQLVVSLSYAGAPAAGTAEESVEPPSAQDEDLTTAPFRVQTGARTTEPHEEPEEHDEVECTPSFGRASIELSQSAAPARVAQVPPASVEASDPEEPIEDELEAAPATLHTGEQPDVDEDDLSEMPAGIQPSVQERVGAIAKKIAPRLKTASAGAGAALGKVMATVREKREERKQAAAKATGPKRKTAPPPSGALRTDGKRLVRDQKAKPAVEAEAPEVPTELVSGRKKSIFSGVLGLLAVLAIYFASSHFADASADKDPATAEEGSDEAPSIAKPAAAPETQTKPAAAPGPGGVATADVPLFGATPLSTTEAVPVPPEPGTLPAEDEPAADEGQEDDADEPSDAFGKLLPEWGVGEVSDPTVLRLKMDGKIDGIVGSETATGFKIIVPGRKSISSAAGFKRKDKRLDEVKVVNFPDRVEVTMLFRKEVPGFVARAKGKRLVIELATKSKKKKKKKKRKKKK